MPKFKINLEAKLEIWYKSVKVVDVDIDFAN